MTKRISNVLHLQKRTAWCTKDICEESVREGWQHKGVSKPYPIYKRRLPRLELVTFHYSLATSTWHMEVNEQQRVHMTKEG